MLKRQINYEDLDGNLQSKEYYFNLSATELVTLNFVKDGGDGLEEMLKRAIAEKNVSLIIEMFSEVISKSYGVRSEDGQRFIKSETLVEEFRQSPAYDTLLMELMTDLSASQIFFAGILPKNLDDQIAAMQMQNAADVLARSSETQMAQVDAEPWITEDREPTKFERKSMNRDQLLRALKAREARKSAKEDPNSDLLAQFDD